MPNSSVATIMANQQQTLVIPRELVHQITTWFKNTKRKHNYANQRQNHGTVQATSYLLEETCATGNLALK
jgi:hypothetical protein